jgi:D-alanyl-D-alanine carboxypeptidase
MVELSFGIETILFSALLTLGFNIAATPPQATAQTIPSFNVTVCDTIQNTTPDNTKTSSLPRQHTELPRGNKYAAVVMDSSTGEVFYERNADKPLNPASTTKVMTSYLVFEAIRDGKLSLDQKLTVSAYAGKFGAPAYSTNLGLKTGQKITVRDALKGILVHSSNDAAVVLAEAVSGTEAKFAKKMNETAERLGMTSSHFVNANGWPDRPLDRQKTSAHDLALLCRAIVVEYPEKMEFFNQHDFTYTCKTSKGKVIKKTTYKNTNFQLMDSYEGLDMSKTGWVRESGSNLVASAERDGHRVIAVVLGAKNKDERKEDMTLLLDYGFLRFDYPDAVYPPTPEQYKAAEILAARDTIRLERIEPRPIVLLPTLTPDTLALRTSAMPSFSVSVPTKQEVKEERKEERKKEKAAIREKMALNRREDRHP